MHRRLICYDCGRVAEYPAVRCTCGEPLWFDIDPPAAWPDTGKGVWRYADWLPTSTGEGIGMIAGGTPLLRTDRLEDYAGCHVSVKLETTNTTGTFKDRGSAVGLAGTTGTVGTVSHGNMAMSMAAHAAAESRECIVLVPADISTNRLAHIAQYGPTIVRVDGEYGQLYYDTIDWDRGISFVNSDTPLRVAGQKTTALEICEVYAPRVPTAIVLPVSSGGHASSMWKALRELRSTGLIDSVPALYLVQAGACDPIARAFEAGETRVTKSERGTTIAYSIANPDPPSGNRALAAVNATGGAVISVDDDAIRDAQRHLATAAGMSVEPASATALAGLHALSRNGTVSATDDVVLVATGTGFRSAPEPPDSPPVLARADLPEFLESHQGNSYNPPGL